MSRHFSTRDLSGPLFVLALGLASTGQYLFTGEWFTRLRDSHIWDWKPQYTLASAFLLAAVACALWAASLCKATPSGDAGLQAARRAPALPVLAALGCYLAALALYAGGGETPLVQALWAGGAVTLVAGLWHADRPAGASSWTEQEYLAVALLTLLGFALRFWRLTEIPNHVDNDIPWIGTAALGLIERNDYSWVGFSIEAGHLQSYAQLHAWSMRLFGPNHFGLVITSVIAGTLTLPAAYLLGRELFNRRVALIAMALLTCSYTHIHFSRILFGASATLFATLTVALVFRGLRRGELVWFALAGLSTSAGLLFYDSGRVVPLIALAVAGWWLIWQRDLLRANLRGVGIYALGALVGFGPMLVFGIRDFELFAGRGGDVTLWEPRVWEHATATYGVSTFPEVLAIQATRTLLTFHLYSDNSPQFAFPRPMVLPLTASLLTIGLGIALLRIRETRFFTLLIWIGLTFVLGGVITYDPPFWPHLNIVLPAVMVLAGIAADTLIDAWPERWARWVRPVLCWLLALAIGASAIHSWQIYYDFVRDNAGPRHRMSRYISSLPDGYTVYLVSDEHTPQNYAFRFFNRDVPMVGQTPAELSASAPALDRPLLFIVDRHDELIPVLEERYPGGELIRHPGRDKATAFVSYRVVPPGYAPLARPAEEPGSLSWLPAALLGLLGGWMLRTAWEMHRLRAARASG